MYDTSLYSPDYDLIVRNIDSLSVFFFVKQPSIPSARMFHLSLKSRSIMLIMGLDKSRIKNYMNYFIRISMWGPDDFYALPV